MKFLWGGGGVGGGENLTLILTPRFVSELESKLKSKII